MGDKTLNDIVSQYLMQQQEVFGNVLYTEKGVSTDSAFKALFQDDTITEKNIMPQI